MLLSRSAHSRRPKEADRCKLPSNPCACFGGCRPGETFGLVRLSAVTVFSLVAALALGLPAVAFAQGAYLTNGTEYAIAGALPGDQVRPGLSLGTSGGYLVWEDN